MSLLDQSNENYLISKARKSVEQDPCAAQAWMIVAKSLYPADFGTQFEAYQLEKSSDNPAEAAKCFSYIVETFHNQPVELLHLEIARITSALRVPEGNTNAEQDFYVRMFQHISYEVQHKILPLTANQNDQDRLDHCKLVLVLLKRFPQAIPTHTPRLLETLLQVIKTFPHYDEMLVLEVLPLIQNKPPELSAPLVHRIMSIALEFYIKIMFKEANELAVNDSWKKIFECLNLCGKMLKWETFMFFNKNWSKEVYWQRLLEISTIVTSSPATSDESQIVFYGTILFILSLQDYINNVKSLDNEQENTCILVEGFNDLPDGQPIEIKRRKIELSDKPLITVCPPCSNQTSSSLFVAANCWKILHSNEKRHMEFTQLMLNLPLSLWINRFLIDFTVYLDRTEEANRILTDPNGTKDMSKIEKNLRLLGLSLKQPFDRNALSIIIAILRDLPTCPGSSVKNLTARDSNRHLILLPITRKAVIQYCTKILIDTFKKKIFSDLLNWNTYAVGYLLCLLQVDWPNEINLAETIFEMIHTRRSFSFLQFPTYIINVDFIEEFMHMYHSNVQLEFTVPAAAAVGQRRIGTRGSDKGVKEDFKQIIRLQILKSNTDVDSLIINLIIKEQIAIAQHLFG